MLLFALDKTFNRLSSSVSLAFGVIFNSCSNLSIPSLSADFDLDKLVEDYIPSQDDCKDLSTLKQAIENFGKKADDAFAGMNVSDEDAAAIKDMLAQSDIVKLIDDARATLDEALEQAKTDARNYLLSLKSARLA